MRKLENYTGEQARSYKKFAQHAKGDREDFEKDLNFNEKPNKFVKYNETKQLVKSIKDQIDYYGYEIEPFHMKNERDIGNFDDGGFFVFDKEKDKAVNDAWLDQLDQSNMFQELQEKAQAENSKKMKKQIKEANKNFEERIKKTRREGFFKSSRFSSKQEAEEYYKNNQVQEESDSEVEAENEIQQNDTQNNNQEEQNTEQLQLEDLEVVELKEILSELLENDETPTQAINRVKQKLASQQKKKVFKKNVRKNSEQTEQQKKEEMISEESQAEAKKTLEMLVDICTIIVKKTNDPEIYSKKKEELIPPKQQEDDIF